MMFICKYTCSWTSLVAQTVKHLPTMRETRVQSLGREEPLEKEMATHSQTLAWKIPWMEEPGGLQSMGSQRVGLFLFLSVRVLTHTYTRVCTSSPVSALLSQALFACSHPRTPPSPPSESGADVLGAPSGSGLQLALDTPRPDPAVLRPHPEVAGACPLLAQPHHPGGGPV